MQPFHTWNSCSSHTQNEPQDGTVTDYESLEDSLLETQMSEDQSQNPCSALPAEAVVDCEHFTDDAHDMAGDDTSCVVHIAGSPLTHLHDIRNLLTLTLNFRGIDTISDLERPLESPHGSQKMD